MAVFFHKLPRMWGYLLVSNHFTSMMWQRVEVRVGNIIIDHFSLHNVRVIVVNPLSTLTIKIRCMNKKVIEIDWVLAVTWGFNTLSITWNGKSRTLWIEKVQPKKKIIKVMWAQKSDEPAFALIFSGLFSIHDFVVHTYFLFVYLKRTLKFIFWL